MKKFSIAFLSILLTACYENHYYPEPDNSTNESGESTMVENTTAQDSDSFPKPPNNNQIKCSWDFVYWPKAASVGFSTDGYGNFWLPSGQYMASGRSYYVPSLNHFFVVRRGILYYSTYCQ